MTNTVSKRVVRREVGMKDNVIFRNKWIEFCNKFGFEFEYHVASYFDERPMLHILLGWGQLFIHLPFHTGIDECEPPRYGFYWFGSALWLCCGKKVYAFHAPWSWDWVRTSYLTKDGKWIHETKGNYLSCYNSVWEPVLWLEKYPYRYILKNGTIQNVIATVKVEEREWRRKFLRLTRLFNKVSRDIAVNFSGEVGERTGSWKGGCTGCGYEILPGEKPLDTLRRMEKERKF